MILPQRLIDFLSIRLGQPAFPLSPEIGLEKAYGIAGLDTITLYQDFVAEFGLTVPGDLDISRHVTAERLEPLHHLKRLLSASYRAATAYHDLTLRELTNMLTAGTWLPPPLYP